MAFKQIDCFDTNFKYWKLLAIYPGNDKFKYYKNYSKIFLLFIILYVLFLTINFYFLPGKMDMFIGEMIFYFPIVSVMSKVFTFIFQRQNIMKILTILESDIFQPKTDEGYKIISKAKMFNIRYWKIVAVVSYTSHFMKNVSPLIMRIFKPIDLVLPISSYSFLSEKTIETYIYPLYVYQTLGMTFYMLYNVTVDTFFLGIMIFAIAQLDILDLELRNVTENLMPDSLERASISKLKEAIIHFTEVAK